MKRTFAHGYTPTREAGVKIPCVPRFSTVDCDGSRQPLITVRARLALQLGSTPRSTTSLTRAAPAFDSSRGSAGSVKGRALERAADSVKNFRLLCLQKMWTIDEAVTLATRRIHFQHPRTLVEEDCPLKAVAGVRFSPRVPSLPYKETPRPADTRAGITKERQEFCRE